MKREDNKSRERAHSRDLICILKETTSSVACRRHLPLQGKARSGTLRQGCTHLICPLRVHLPLQGEGLWVTAAHFSVARNGRFKLNLRGMEGPQALHLKSAGRALPARGEFSRRGARDPERKIHSARILRPEISAEISSKSASSFHPGSAALNRTSKQPQSTPTFSNKSRIYLKKKLRVSAAYPPP